MLRERNETYMLLFATIDMLAAFLSFWAAFLIRFFLQDGDISSINLGGYLFVGIVITVSQVMVFNLMNMYRSWKIGLLKNEFGSLIMGTIITIFVALGVIFFLKTHRYSRLVILYFGIINIVLVSVCRSILRAAINHLHMKGKQLRPMVVIGTGKAANHVELIIRRNQLYGYNVKGFVQLPNEDAPEVAAGKVLGQLNELSHILKEIEPYHVIFAGDTADSEILQQAIKICSYEGILLHLVPSFSELITSRIQIESLEGIPLISLRDIPARRGFSRLLKRVFDTLFALLFIVLFSPFYFLIGLFIKLSSRGPVLLKQERVGLNNKSFQLLKFRTMYVQQSADSDTIWTKSHDPRVTPVGRILRKFSLDETPQFFNVLFGKMSVVGPRPERPYWVEQFKERYKGYMQRHGMKAGITGWAQINGLRGDTSIEERVSADIYYIENWSFLLDLKIIALTPFKSMIDKNAY